MSTTAGALLVFSGVASAQVTPAAGYTPPDDTPSVRVGGVLYADFTDTIDPKATDVNGNTTSVSTFNVGRAYINITGQLNHRVQFRITPDVSRETGSGSSLNGSLEFRMKYAYAQLNLDDWAWRGTYVRFGAHQTPLVDFEEGIYRYRFQGTIFEEREGYLSSSDFGVSFRSEIPHAYGEFVVGLYNGETYTRPDTNNQKAVQMRGTLRPLPAPGPLRGLRVSGFYDLDHVANDLNRRRAIGTVTYEHRRVNAGFTYLDATDQATAAVNEIDSHGYSVWATPRTPMGIEGLLRYDHLRPNTANDSEKERTLVGVAYWPHMSVASVSSSVLLDYEQVNYHDYSPGRPTEKRIAVHVLLSF